MASKTSSDNSRKVYIDFLRIIACIMVIFNHTGQLGDVGFLQFLSCVPGEVRFWISLLCSILCKTGVPLFFMISGATLLGKEERIIDTLKRIPKFAADIIIFSILYCWSDALFSGAAFSIEETLYGIVKSEYTHLWYLYAYIALLISLPFFRRMVKGLNMYSSIYLLIIAVLILGVLKCFEYSIISLNPNLIISWIPINIFIYPAAGYIIDNIVNVKAITNKIMILLCGVTLMCVAWSMIIESDIQIMNPGDADEEYLTAFSLCIAIVLFIIVKKEFNCHNEWFRKGVIETGKCVYGIYLIHFWVLCSIPMFANIWMELIRICPLGELVGSIICSFCVFIICEIVVYFLRMIPGIKWLL